MSEPKSDTTEPSLKDIVEEVEAARKHLYTALGSVGVLTGYIPNSPAIAGHIKQALAMLPKRSAESHG